MMVQENPIELEKTMVWSRRSKLRWNSFLFMRLWFSFSRGVRIEIKGLFIKIEGFRILLNQEDQLQIASRFFKHPMVKIIS